MINGLEIFIIILFVCIISALYWSGVELCFDHYICDRRVDLNITRFFISCCPIINIIFGLKWKHKGIINWIKNTKFKSWFEW